MPVRVPGRGSFALHFRGMSLDEFGDVWRDFGKDGDVSQYLQRAVDGWAGVCDDDGRPLTFSTQGLQQLAAMLYTDPPLRSAIGAAIRRMTQSALHRFVARQRVPR